MIGSVLFAMFLLSQNKTNIQVSGSISTTLMNAIIHEMNLDKKFLDALDIKGPEGSMPEIARREIHLDDRGEHMSQSILQACKKLNLWAPTEEQKKAEPEITCAGKWQVRQVSVYFSIECKESCTGLLETRALPF